MSRTTPRNRASNTFRRMARPAAPVLLALLAALLWTRPWAGRVAAQPAPAAADAPGPQGRAAAAAKAYRLYSAAEQAGQVAGIELVYTWSRRWMEEEKAAADKKGQRAAAEAHRDRMRDLEARTQRRVQAGLATPGDAAAAEYYRLEAEAWAEPLAR